MLPRTMPVRHAFPAVLDVKAEMEDITVLGDVFLTFDPQLTGIFSTCFTTTGDVVVIGNGLCPDETALKIRMNDTRGLRCC